MLRRLRRRPQTKQAYFILSNHLMKTQSIFYGKLSKHWDGNQAAVFFKGRTPVGAAE